MGYNATYTCPTQMRVGTISIGYADGYLRAFAGNGMVLSDNMEMPVVGRVSMDLVTVDIAMARHLNEGDWVEINYDLNKASQATGFSQYELLTNLGCRYDKIWQKMSRRFLTSYNKS